MNQVLMQCLLVQLDIIANKEYFRVVSHTCPGNYCDHVFIILFNVSRLKSHSIMVYSPESMMHK